MEAVLIVALTEQQKAGLSPDALEALALLSGEGYSPRGSRKMTPEESAARLNEQQTKNIQGGSTYTQGFGPKGQQANARDIEYIVVEGLNPSDPFAQEPPEEGMPFGRTSKQTIRRGMLPAWEKFQKGEISLLDYNNENRNWMGFTRSPPSEQPSIFSNAIKYGILGSVAIVGGYGALQALAAPAAGAGAAGAGAGSAAGTTGLLGIEAIPASAIAAPLTPAGMGVGGAVAGAAGATTGLLGLEAIPASAVAAPLTPATMAGSSGGIVNSAIASGKSILEFLDKYPTVANQAINAIGGALSPDEIDIMEDQQQLRDQEDEDRRNRQNANRQVGGVNFGTRTGPRTLTYRGTDQPVFTNGILNKRVGG
jgi:hypothetical protein